MSDLPNPKFAPRRNDLPWLRRRRRPPAVVPDRPLAKATPAPAPTPAPSPPRTSALAASTGGSGAGGKIDYTRRDRARPTPAPAPAAPPRREPAPPRREAAPAAASSGNPLDLSAPTPAPAPPSGGGTGLDLDLGGGSPPPRERAPSSSTSLDLDAPADPGAPPRRRAAPPAPPPERHHVVRRTRSGAATLLDFSAPVVTLDRLQSGIGQLTFDAVVGDEVGDLRIGAAWALTDGRTGTVELAAERRGGPDGRRPVVWAQREGRFERIALDLRQSRSLSRLLVYAFSPTKATIAWGGTVVVTTYGGDRVDAPVVSAPSPAVLALVTVYNVDGEFVLRSEMDPVAGTVRDTCRAFGYDRITWLDDRTPVG